MRLICPECNALYDIDSAMIPPEGREVECSACGHVWMQDPETLPATGKPRKAARLAWAEPDSGTYAGDSSLRGLTKDLREAARSHTDSLPELGEAPVLQRPLPDDVLSILREETARELGARRAVRGDVPESPVTAPAMSMESPEFAIEALAEDAEPDSLAFTDLPAAVAQPSQETAHPTPEPMQVTWSEPAAAKDERPPVPRRRVPRGLPDVEQLAATIQTAGQVPEAEEEAVTTLVTTPENVADDGYRTGLIRALSVAAALAFAYVGGTAWVGTGTAPGAVASMVAGVDGLRAGLQGAVDTVIGRGGH